MCFGSPGPSEFFLRYATGMPWPRLTEIVWEDAEQGLGMAMSTVATEKNRELLFIATCFTNGDIVFFTSISRGRPPENRQSLSPAKSQILL